MRGPRADPDTRPFKRYRPAIVRPSQQFWLNTGFEQDDLALRIRSSQVDRSTQAEHQEIRRQNQARKTAGMEPGRSLFRYRRAGSHARPRKDGREMRRV